MTESKLMNEIQIQAGVKTTGTTPISLDDNLAKDMMRR